MTRVARGLGAALAAGACAASLVLAVGPRVAAAQATAPAWRATALASFDDVWTTISDTFYDPTFGGVDWAGVRAELRPKIEAAATMDEARVVIRAMLARLGRSHFALMAGDAVDAALPGEAAVPLDVRIAAEGAIVTRVRGSAVETVRPGDVIVSVDGWTPDAAGADAEGSGDDRLQRVARWRAVNRRLHGVTGSRAQLTLRSPDGRQRTVAVEREIAPGQVVNFGNLQGLRVHAGSREARTPGGRRVGVIAFNLWLPAINVAVATAIDTYRTGDGLVIDLRGNPGGLADMIRGVAGYVFPESVVLGRMRTRATPEPLVFLANPRLSTPDGRSVTPFGGPVAILVDELTASTSECFAGALQSLGRARVFGRQTMGQALPALTRRLPNGDALMYAIGDFETSTGVALEGDGVTPDEAVALTPAGLAGGGDPDLAAALGWIDRVRGR